MANVGRRAYVQPSVKVSLYRPGSSHFKLLGATLPTAMFSQHYQALIQADPVLFEDDCTSSTAEKCLVSDCQTCRIIRSVGLIQLIKLHRDPIHISWAKF